VTIEAKLTSTFWTKTFDVAAVPVPLSDVGPPNRLSFALRLDTSDISQMVEAQHRDGFLTLAIMATAESLEGIRWTTSVNYQLRFRQSDREKIDALTADNEVCQQHWANQVTVQADHSIAPGTWQHRRLTAN